ncbi:Centrin-1 [Tritrichomonas foetus]|uniref:Centrin-1 n=1 Tax=Tritrichomonas foetus TaxID=1144522 RepID=A0A1J4JZB9_9EUKA|nr:Centrin-1 [Tritrichomonas foetus]|eukprot:OHT04323.1 Centrin-1 [Tritrichomonas foetus]
MEIQSYCPGLSSEQNQEIREAFDIFDVCHSGVLDSNEFQALVKALGFHLSDHEKVSIKRINFNDLALILSRKFAIRDFSFIFEIYKEKYDYQKITINFIKKVAQEMGKDFNEDELKQIYNEVLKNMKKTK